MHKFTRKDQTTLANFAELLGLITAAQAEEKEAKEAAKLIKKIEDETNEDIDKNPVQPSGNVEQQGSSESIPTAQPDLPKTHFEKQVEAQQSGNFEIENGAAAPESLNTDMVYTLEQVIDQATEAHTESKGAINIKGILANDFGADSLKTLAPEKYFDFLVNLSGKSKAFRNGAR